MQVSAGVSQICPLFSIKRISRSYLFDFDIGKDQSVCKKNMFWIKNEIEGQGQSSPKFELTDKLGVDTDT